MRALGHAPYVLGRKALLARGCRLSLLQLRSAKWWILSKLPGPNAQEAKAWHSEKPVPHAPGTSLSATRPALVTSSNFQPGSAKRQGGGELGSSLVFHIEAGLAQNM